MKTYVEQTLSAAFSQIIYLICRRHIKVCSRLQGFLVAPLVKAHLKHLPSTVHISVTPSPESVHHLKQPAQHPRTAGPHYLPFSIPQAPFIFASDLTFEVSSELWPRWVFRKPSPESTGICISHIGQESRIHSNYSITVPGSSNQNTKAMLACK